ncbi:phosphate ABC transporter permease PstA [Paenibacillus sp. TRM 82003]|uniref:phosphate ABC transporter permease PstA n=1 Tax=Kineococcus sp. TRM81007 TaxID=2925831 RepID=UPI001F582E15|nr:phosphate ABC transporter permease PstA [Kineococcus sp. TRM81007]MCI2238626.1 phosphate ABC transporter permease PstA [Kineococcus sp. TRM81007]MCI3927288.1 phosphate ABC transporter permease PstA [Paenibacillus sp. TRM 82003]
MTTTTGKSPREVLAAVDQPLSKAALPGWTPWALLAASVLVAVAVLLPGGTSIAAVAVLTAIVHLVLTGAVSRAKEGPRKAKDRVVTALVTIAFLLAMVPLVSVVWTVVSNGAARFDATFFTWSMQGVLGEGGGGLHAIWGTILVTLIATLISVPVGLLTAVYLVEYGGKSTLARAITFLVDVMTGIPSIVAGLFVAALFVILVGPGTKLGIMGSIALSVLMIPVVVRSTEEMLKLVPNDLREAAYALGVPKWRTIIKVVLRTSISGIATGITLAVARVAGETAPLLVTVGTTVATNFNPFEGRMATLPVYAYYSYTQPGVPPQPGIDRAWTAALVLIILVMALNLAARMISRFFSPKAGR